MKDANISSLGIKIQFIGPGRFQEPPEQIISTAQQISAMTAFPGRKRKNLSLTERFAIVKP